MITVISKLLSTQLLGKMKNQIGIKINKFGNGLPVVAIVYCMHGDEVLGEDVIQKFTKNIKPKKGSLLTILANEKAFKSKKRFIDKDLNRCFPGKKDGNYEEKVAYELKESLRGVEYVIDIHSTTSVTDPFFIITKKNSKILNIVKKSGPEKIVFMRKNLADGRSLIDHVQNGISLEYSSTTYKKSVSQALRDVRQILNSLGMLGTKSRQSKETQFYEITGSIPMKKGFKAKKLFGNFSRVRKDQAYGTVNSTNIRADFDFYPVFYGEEAYPGILSLTSKKKKTPK